MYILEDDPGSSEVGHEVPPALIARKGRKLVVHWQPRKKETSQVVDSASTRDSATDKFLEDKQKLNLQKNGEGR